MNLQTDALTQPAITETVISLYHLGVGDDGMVIDVSGEPFSPTEYSEFKYGNLRHATRFAKRLARTIVAEMGDSVDEAFVSSSAYKQVPTAAAVITDLALSEFSMLDHEPAGLVRIDRGIVLATDYAAMSAEEREAAMEANALEINSATSDAIQGRDVIVIDDVRITGSHERAILRQLGKAGVRRAIFGYVAVMDGDIARRYPELEDQINSSRIKHVADLIPTIQANNFRLNARTCKFILNSDPDSASYLFQQIPLESARTIVASMIADGYHSNPAFADTFEVIQRATSLRSKTLIDNPAVLHEVVTVMQREQGKAAHELTFAERIKAAGPVAKARRAIDEYVEKRHAAIDERRQNYTARAAESYERYNAKITSFVQDIEQMGRMVKIKFDAHGLIDRSWLIPSAERHAYIAVSVRREMEEELYTARAVLLKLPKDKSDGLKYTELFHYEKFLDPKDVDAALEKLKEQAKKKFPDNYLTYDLDDQDGGNNPDFTPGVALLWSVFPDFDWTRAGEPVATNSAYFQYENSKPVRCIDA